MTVEYGVNMTVEYEGKEYYADKEDSYISCKGCVFDQADVDYKWCACKDDKMKQDCFSAQIVWKEVSTPMLKKTAGEEPKFTVEQVLLAAGNYLREQPIFQDYDKIYATALEAITEDLMFQQDPDYQLYLLLKQKYDKA